MDMIRTRLTWLSLSLLLIGACHPNHEIIKLGDQTLRVPKEHVITELLSTINIPWLDKSQSNAPLIFKIKDIPDVKIRALLQKYILTEDFWFFVQRAETFDLRPVQREGERKPVRSVADIPSNDADIMAIPVIGNQGILEAHCLAPVGMYKDKLCTNFVVDGKFLIKYDVPLPFMLDAGRKKALDDFLRNQVRQWTVKP
jgi:hypothetical protein